MDCPICSWSQDDPQYLCVYEVAHWRVCLAPNQTLLGRCVVSLKRHAGDLAEMSADEMVELLSVIVRLEAALRSAFGATMFNWSCYMNLAYREQAPNPHVHWWAVPRYSHPVPFEGLVFDDPDFGNPYDHKRWLDIPARARTTIVQMIQGALLPTDLFVNP